MASTRELMSTCFSLLKTGAYYVRFTSEPNLILKDKYAQYYPLGSRSHSCNDLVFKVKPRSYLANLIFVVLLKYLM